MSQSLYNGAPSECMPLKGGRRPTGKGMHSEEENSSTPLTTPNPEAIIRRARRRHTAKYKMEILDAYDRCATTEERGFLMRKEGLYSSHISYWRKARSEGALSALSQKRGRRQTRTPQDEQLTLLKAENQRLQEQLSEAETIIDIQKKVSEILGNRIKKPNNNGESS